MARETHGEVNARRGDAGSVTCGIQWARQNGVFVLNMSFMIDRSEAVTNEINLAYHEGRMLVAATGVGVAYPASLPNVIAVGSPTVNDGGPPPN
jgi:hypothetical protein